MFCTKCGKELPDGVSFCTGCGNKISAFNETAKTVETRFCTSCGKKIPKTADRCPECNALQKNVHALNAAPTVAVPRKPIDKGFIFIGGVIAAVIIVALVLSIVIKPTINLNDYVSVEYTGYDTVGRAQVSFDYDAFSKKYEKALIKAQKKKDPVKNLEDLTELDFERQIYALDGDYKESNIFLDYYVSYELDKQEQLTNGDTLVLKWNCKDEDALQNYGVTLKYSDITSTVSGLTEVEMVNPFDAINVEFTGISSSGHASIVCNTSGQLANELYFVMDRNYDLSNGDIVTVSVDISGNEEYYIEKYGAIPSPTKNTYTVEGLDWYITKASDISADAMNSMVKNGKKWYAENVAQYYDETTEIKEINDIGYVVACAKNPDEIWGSANTVTILYDITVKNKFDNGRKKYDHKDHIFWYATYNNLMNNADGKTSVNSDNISTPYSNFYIDSEVSDGWFGTKRWNFYGYESSKEMLNDLSDQYGDYNLETITNEAASPSEDDEEIKEDAKSGDSFYDGEGIIFPYSSEELIDEREIRKLSNEELRAAINEIYAREGYIFSDESLGEFYSQFDWYMGRYKSDEFTLDFFNDIERENIDRMQKERNKR